ncbi:protein ZNRD2 [Pristis pectinata]|uniref:protein ZNRD2 n=1 Tax=Pristis pectinata TaxID=685728 RepID=UPI00223DA675|nr:protein ZNRD2 [Pristis pectinata]XP_051900995.1 protein ZNRD2 [Pristis pectinata]XP_051900996.1 protein ZNRD2 [Pristis pectinata]XP_051900997.1 protein ZNRD2 [Pristis pectinata]
MAMSGGDEEFAWKPPTEAEMKVIEARRERHDKISKLMGDYLLKGYRMLADSCVECGTVLLQDKKQKTYCVACQELNSDLDKDNPALNPQAALSQVRERQRLYNGHPQDLSVDTRPPEPPKPAATSPVPPPEAAASLPCCTLAGAAGEAERALLRKMAWACGELERAASVEYSSQLCGLIRSCADSLHSLKRLA